MVWNKELRFGYITIKLHGKGEEAVATIDQWVLTFYFAFILWKTPVWLIIARLLSVCVSLSLSNVSFCPTSKAAEFKKYSETRLLAQFDRDIQSVKKVSLKFSTGNPLKAKQKLSVLRIRLTHLERKERCAPRGFLKMCDVFPKCQVIFTFVCFFTIDPCVDMTSSCSRTTRSPSSRFPVKTPTSEKN